MIKPTMRNFCAGTIIVQFAVVSRFILSRPPPF